MRPVLKPALRRIWRHERAIQLGTDPTHAVVLDGVDDAAGTVLTLMDGTRESAEIVSAAVASGMDADDVAAFLDLLTAANVVDDAAVAPHGLRAEDRRRLDPDLASLSLLTPHPAGGPRLLDSRRATHVLVVGAGRVGAVVASLLAAAGIGHVAIRDEAVAEPGDAIPGGPQPDEVGQPRAIAALGAARRAGGPSVEGAVRPPTAADARRADFGVLALDGWLAPPASVLDVFAGAGLPYVVTGVRETYGVVGPLVIPGRTACPRCLDLHRADRDPHWPAVAAQLSTDARGATASCDVVLATGVAALTAGQVLAHVMGPGVTRCINATLEFRLPTWTLRRRTWPAHRDCPCEAATAAERDAASERRAAAHAATKPHRAGRASTNAGAAAEHGGGR